MKVPVLAIDASGGDRKEPMARAYGAIRAAVSAEGKYHVCLFGPTDTGLGQYAGESLTVVECRRRNDELKEVVLALTEHRINAWITANDSQRLQAVLHTSGLLNPDQVPGLLLPWPTRHPLGFGFRTDGGMSSKVIDPKYYLRLALGAIETLSRVYRRKQPKVGLLNIARERASRVVRHIHEHLVANKLPGYVGYTEPDDFYRGEIDLQLGDGYDMNVILKELEASVPFLLEVMGRAMFPKGYSDAFGVGKAAVEERLGYNEYLVSPVSGIGSYEIRRMHGKVNADQVAGAFMVVAAQITGR